MPSRSHLLASSRTYLTALAARLTHGLPVKHSLRVKVESDLAEFNTLEPPKTAQECTDLKQLVDTIRDVWFEEGVEPSVPRSS